jgi:biotin carboxyl carrier protein
MRKKDQGVTMKKTLLSITVVLLALTMFFAGCDSPTGYTVTNKEDLPELDGPEWVEAKAYAGANLITWAFVKDAETYTVYRQRTDRKDALAKLGTTEHSATVETQYYYVDAVDFDTQLENDVEYTYYIVADAGNYSGGNWGIMGGSASKSVKAIIPARYKDGSKTTVLALQPEDTPAERKLDAAGTAVTSEKITKSDGSEELLVSWPNNHPGFQYTVKYELGEALSLKIPVTTPPSTPGTDKDVYYHGPLWGGTNKIRIAVTLNEDEYYYAPVEIAKALPAYALTEPLGSGFAPASITPNRDTNIPTVAKITWNINSVSAKNAADYKLYRIEATDNPSGNNQITVTGDWTLVNGSISGPDGSNNITAKDFGLDPAKSYLYVLYAEINGRKSAPVYATLAPVTEKIPAITFAIEDISTVNDDNGTISPKITIGWIAQADDTADVKYTLERILLAYPTNIPDDTDDITPEGLTPKAGRYTVIDTAVQPRHSYVYRLTRNNGGVKTSHELLLNEDPFLPTVSVGLSAAVSTSTAYAIDVSVPYSGSYKKDLYVDIYRAEVPEIINSSVSDNNFTEEAVEDSAFVKIKENLHLYTDTTYTDKDADPATAGIQNLRIGTKYIYRHVVKVSPDGTAGNATTVIDNTAATSGTPIVKKTGFVKQVTAPTVGTVTNAASHTVDTVTTLYFKVGTPVKAGTKIELQKRADPPTDVANPWSLVTTETVRLTSDTPPTGSTGLTEGDYYIQFTQPDPSPDPDYAYRLVLVNQTGTLANRSASSTGVVTGTTAVAGW